MRQIKLLAMAAAFGLNLLGNAFGQTAGDEVVVIERETKIQIGEDKSRQVGLGKKLKVVKIDGDWLWVSFDDTQGWVQRNKVVLASEEISHITDRLRKSPKNGRLLLWRANAWYRNGDRINAIRDLTKTIEVKFSFEETWAAYSRRAGIYMELKQYENAIADYTYLIQAREFGKESTYMARASAYLGAKQFERAVSDYVEVIRLNPDNPGPYNDIAWMAATCVGVENRDGGVAFKFATEACELSAWKHPAYLDTLAAAYAEVGQFSKAVETQQKAMDLVDSSQKADLRSRLDLYRSGRPYRNVQ